MPDNDRYVYCASNEAIAAATAAWWEAAGGPPTSGALAAALVAAHDPALGLDRSVCLRDVLDFMRAYSGPLSTWEDVLAGHFGGT